MLVRENASEQKLRDTVRALILGFARIKKKLKTCQHLHVRGHAKPAQTNRSSFARVFQCSSCSSGRFEEERNLANINAALKNPLGTTKDCLHIFFQTNSFFRVSRNRSLSRVHTINEQTLESPRHSVCGSDKIIR